MEQTGNLEPIVLTPPSVSADAKKERKWLATLRLMAAGWLLGNLIFGALVASGIIFLIGSSGLVKVPFLSDKLFSKPASAQVDQKALETANKKLADIDSLVEGQVLPELTLSEEELNALLTDLFSKNQTDLLNPALRLTENKFSFSAFLAETGAPVRVEGEFDTSSGILRLALLKTRFGNIDLPPQLANSFLSESLAKVGLSLDNTALPARKVTIENGQVVLEDVTSSDE